MNTIGNLPLFTFPTIIAFGVGLGLLWSIWPVAEIPVLSRIRLNAGMITLAGALSGGRVGAVLLNWSYYQQHWTEIIQVWLGGLSWIGAFTGGILALWIAARIYKHPVLKLADDLLPLFTSLTTSAWLACWVTGYAYGVETQAWWGLPTRDEWGLISDRWPTQLTGSLATLGFHWFVEVMKARGRVRTPGLAANLLVASFSVVLLAISPFRADPRPIWRGIPLEIWFSIGILALSLITTVFLVISAHIGSRLAPNKFPLSGEHEN